MTPLAPRWSTILLAPTAPRASQPLPAPSSERVYQALPADSYLRSKITRTEEVAEAPALAPVMADAIRHVTVKPGDVLAMKAQPGDYYWKIARHFAKEDTIGAYVKDLINQNGGTSLVKTGQLLNLPFTDNADYELQMAIAVQKVVQLRSLFGDRTPELDWSSIAIEPGPVDSFWVSFREAGSEKRRTFMVSDDLSGLYPGRYSVITEAEARQYFPN